MNQNPEQLARDTIDADLIRSGWLILDKSKINLNAGLGVAVREYQTDIGPADYVLFVNKKPVGILEAKRAEKGVHLIMKEEQSEGYAKAKRILFLVGNKNLDKNAEQLVIMASVSFDDNRKLKEQYGIPNKTLNSLT